LAISGQRIQYGVLVGSAESSAGDFGMGIFGASVAVQVRPQIMNLALTFVSGGHSQMAAVRVFGEGHAMRIQFIGK